MTDASQTYLRVWPEATEYEDGARRWFSGGILHEVKGPQRGYLDNECDHFHRSYVAAILCAKKRIAPPSDKRA